MKNKIIPILAITLLATLILTLFVTKEKEAISAEPELIVAEEVQKLSKPPVKESTVTSHRPSSTDKVDTKVSPWTPEGLAKADEILKAFQQETASPEPPKEGMVNKAAAIQKASNQIEHWIYDRSKVADVYLMNEHYVVQFYDFTNPFRVVSNKISASVVVDAWTGQPIGLEYARRGTGIHGLDPKSQTGTEEERAANFERVKSSGMELSMRVRNGRELSDDPSTLSLSPKAAADIAVNHALSRGRTFDNQREPMSILIEDVYIIVLWRQPDDLAEKGPTYDSRVFVDASTGTVIGMEITN